MNVALSVGESRTLCFEYSILCLISSCPWAPNPKGRMIASTAALISSCPCPYLRQAGLKGERHWDFGSRGFDTNLKRLSPFSNSSTFGGQAPPSADMLSHL